MAKRRLQAHDEMRGEGLRTAHPGRRAPGSGWPLLLEEVPVRRRHAERPGLGVERSRANPESTGDPSVPSGWSLPLGASSHMCETHALTYYGCMDGTLPFTTRPC